MGEGWLRLSRMGMDEDWERERHGWVREWEWEWE